MIIYKEISKLNKKFPLLNEEKILLGTDGSVTNILEILFEEVCKVETINQKIVNNTNYREVILKVNETPLVYAISKTPFKNIEEENLREEIKKDLLSADIPIGKIIRKHNLETRREIKYIGIAELDDRLKSLLKTKHNKLPKRTYNIIYKNKILMEITEIFAIRDKLAD
ncbi:chorismate pyruvate-lyase family protein [Methanocaldococcus sp.]|uniref:chorismate pyruvate-lyase family protein n=1 Tax=Methanocaldococcus sp. TaxID=2152917 RepID=UPI0026315BAF|nr:chorismate pyruvate-lyase family protein [Methanocaldococcus sp.]MCQ6254132.1 chorismate pyruvate-lyase family protein [Methanocaldococcus sp.]